jgi:putative transposase
MRSINAALRTAVSAPLLPTRGCARRCRAKACGGAGQRAASAAGSARSATSGSCDDACSATGVPARRSRVRRGAAALRAASRGEFRVLEFSIQPDHLHLIVEGDGADTLRRGIQGLAIRVAKAVNRVLRRCGKVWADRHHTRELRTPREVRNALVYVLTNWKKHVRGAWGLDPASSARWFSGWVTSPVAPVTASPVVTARTWLARWGWRRHGLLDPRAQPCAVPRRR